MSSTRPISSPSYTLVAMLLHWLMALGILLLLLIGLAMTQFALPPARVFTLYQLHKSIGITVLLILLLRIGWRLTHRPPALPEDMRVGERRAAGASHLLLYGFMLALPLTGWAVVSASPLAIPTVLYGTVPWPDLPVLPDLTDKATADAVLARVHAYGAWALIALLALHVAAALRHHLLRRDDVLRRMLPRFPSRNRP